MIARKALLGACISAFLVTACVETRDDASDSSEVDTRAAKDKMTNDEIAKDGAASAAKIPLPETPAQRRELRDKFAAPQSKKFGVLEKVPADMSDQVSGEVPDELLQKIIADLAAKIGADPAEIEVLRAESLTWNDGSLGCGKPGENYTQALVPGYRVILGHDGQPFDYRATEKGYFMLCEQPLLGEPGVGRKPPVQ